LITADVWSALKIQRSVQRAGTKVVVCVKIPTFAAPNPLFIMKYSFLEIAPNIADALQNKRPVVALESTIIAHGMPYPDNVENALRCEAIVREHGALPATIAIIDGKFKVGLSTDEIERLARDG
jgi:pseudouridine-5'-phosphate glycosidase